MASEWRQSSPPCKAMILAAGRGKRLRPLTDSIPKPMVKLNGKPLIEYHIEKLAALGVNEIVINHAWLGEVIEQGLGDGSRWGVQIHYSAEPPGGLETAGGIINALPLLGEQPFLVINGDVFCESDFSELYRVAERMQRAENTTVLAHLLLVPSPAHNQQGDFGVDHQGLALAQGNYTFSGLSVLHPELFKGMEVAFLRLAPILRQAMQQNRVSATVERGFWSDVGTLERLQQTERQLQNSKPVSS